MKRFTFILFFTICLFLTKEGKSQDFYDINTIQTLEINFVWNNWDAKLDSLKATGNGDGRLIANVKINGTNFDSVGVRYKGNSTYRPYYAKNPFNVKLDHIIKQDYQGYETLKLSNVFRDPSFVREVISYEVARRYTPAPKCNFIKVFVNGNYHGVYSNVESIDSEFLKKHFGSKDNTFIKAGANSNWGNPEPLGCSPSNYSFCSLEYLGTDSACYQKYYELKSEHGWQDLIDLTNTLNNNFSSIENILDVDQALWMLAFNNVMVNLDSYSGKFIHNYYLYKDDEGKFQILIWDLNQSLGSYKRTGFGVPVLTINDRKNLTPLLHQNDFIHFLIRKLLNNTRYRKIYLDHVRTIVEENYTNDRLKLMAQSLHALVDSAVQADPIKLYTYQNFLDNLNLTTVITNDVTPGITDLLEGRKAYLTNNSNAFPPNIPEISNVAHTRITPKSYGITAQALHTDTLELKFRIGTNGSFQKIEMFDDGNHGDGVANDNIFGASVSLDQGTAQYYLEAENVNAIKLMPKNAESEFFTIINSINPGDIVINEFMADNIATRADQDGEFDDWIEIYNTTNQAISLNGLCLSDDLNEPTMWAFPDTTIAANGYLVIWADKDDGQAGLHANFKLSKSGEDVLLAKADSTILDSFTFGSQITDRTAGRMPNGVGAFRVLNPTFSAVNFSGTPAPTIPAGNVVVNEFMAVNKLARADQDGEFDDWVELYNTTNTAISLNGVFLSNDATNPYKWAFPDTSIQANSFLIIWLDEDEAQAGLHANFKLAQVGESIILSNLDSSTIDAIQYGPQMKDLACGRFPNGSGNFKWVQTTFSNSNVDFGTIPTPPSNGLVINEFMASNASTVVDQDFELDDWIEIYNNSASPVNLDNFYLTDEFGNPYKWDLPDTTIGGNQYLIVWADKDENQAGLHTNFKLSSYGEKLMLCYAFNQVIDSISFDLQFPDTSFARFPNGTGPFNYAFPTHNAFNNSPPLDAEIINWKASTSNCQIYLEWTTLQEQNTAFFAIERSVDEINFDRIDTLGAAGNSSNPIHYNYLDEKPVEGRANYYRLAQVDLDGSINYAEILAVDTFCSGQGIIKLYPNPVQKRLLYELDQFDIGDIQINIVDVQGRIVYNNTFIYTNSVIGFINRADFSSSAPGVYIFQVKSKGKVQHHKIVLE